SHLCSDNDRAFSELSTLSLHDALPIFATREGPPSRAGAAVGAAMSTVRNPGRQAPHDPQRDRETGQRLRTARIRPTMHPQEAVRSEEHTSELQSPYDLVCRLLLEKKKP